jgi:hypothetical protein
MKNFSSLATFYIAFFVFTTSACRISGSLQGLYSYYNKTAKKAPALIKKPEGSICSLIQTDTPAIYTINGIDLKNCIGHFERSLVYVWRPKCSSDVCISPINLENICRAKNIELFIVAEYYDYETMILTHPVKRPVFGIDCDYYSSNLTKKYLSRFLCDLLGEKKVSIENYYFLFNNGCLTGMSDNLDNINLE